MGSIKNKCAIVGMGCTKFGERWESSFVDLITDAAFEALNDAGVDKKDIQAGWIGYTGSSRTAECLARALKLDYVPVSHVENACATGMEAIRHACFAVAAGVYDLVLVVGAEKVKDSGLAGVPLPGDFTLMHPILDAQYTPPGAYALAATRYFYRYGISPQVGKELLARISVKNHHNGALNPKAHLQREVTLEEVINAPMIASPLGLYDCCPATDGAAAAVITRADLAKSFRHDYLLVKGLGLSVGPGMGAVDTDYDYTHWEEVERASRTAYEDAGIKNPREELSFVQVHDCFTISELVMYEALGLCEKGRSRDDIEAGTFALTGQLPVNTDGGLKSFGHPVGATGVRQIYEVYKQLQGKAQLPTRQLANPKLGLCQNQGGHPGRFQAIVGVLGLGE